MLLKGYYKEKSIQQTNKFLITIINDESVVVPGAGFMPAIENYHVLNVSVPNWEFKKEILKIGPFVYTFPVMDTDGFELTITFEEDSEGTITKFVDWAQRRIMDKEGLFFNPGTNKIKSIIIDVLRSDGVVVNSCEFKDCYFLRASNLDLNYGNNESMKIDVVFGTDMRQLYSIKPPPDTGIV